MLLLVVAVEEAQLLLIIILLLEGVVLQRIIQTLLHFLDLLVFQLVLVVVAQEDLVII